VWVAVKAHSVLAVDCFAPRLRGGML
jgi:hypothetical protein